VLTVGVAAVAVAFRLLGARVPRRLVRWAALVVFVGIMLAFAIIIGFGGVGWNQWGGLLLTVFLAVGGILLSFPLGVLLALGRRSSFRAVRLVCVVYIELIRGVPLIALLFMAAFMLGFFLPPGVGRPDEVTRALVAFVLFTAAYVAEIVRGGLQSVPRGQIEAAQAIGLSPLKTTRLIVLPQALRAVIPGLVGQFISLFKDTSLVFIIGLSDLLTVAETITKQPDFLAQGLIFETLVFISFVYWAGSYWMSRESQRLERRLGVGKR
jgi:general L-amino acid transport system permease protein